MTEMPADGVYGGRSHAEYRKAVRHSRRVRALKVLLPAASALVLAGFVAFSWVGTQIPEGLSVESTAIEDGKLVMLNPVLTGQSSADQPYSLRAARAIQDFTTPDIIVLEDIRADIPVSDSANARLVAKSGTFNRSENRIEFTDAFTVTTADGMSAELQSASFDIEAGNLVTDKAVTVKSPDASVVAQSMQMQDKGRVVVFENQVRMTINPKAIRQSGGGQDPAQDTAAP